jgi:hypothetical protein
MESGVRRSRAWAEVFGVEDTVVEQVVVEPSAGSEMTVVASVRPKRGARGAVLGVSSAVPVV